MRNLPIRHVSLLALASLLPAPGGTVFAAANRPAVAAPPVAIVELFTSEGCSSCPPADALLRQVNLKNAASGQLVVGIGEHVTYWNRLGWKDTYSQEIFSDRQSEYATRLGVEGPYTPQMIVNGREQFVGSDKTRLLGALNVEAAQPRVGLELTRAVLVEGALDTTIELHGAVSKPLDLFAVITDDSDRSNVLRGENAGSLLQHVAVARTLERVGRVSVAGEQRATIHVPADLRSSLHAGHHLVVFVQEPRLGAILGAAVLPL